MFSGYIYNWVKIFGFSVAIQKWDCFCFAVKKAAVGYWRSLSDWAGKNKLISFVTILGTIYLGLLPARREFVPLASDRSNADIENVAERKINYNIKEWMCVS